mgnify:CR=1 FL=1
MTTEKNYKFVVLETTARENQEIFPYQEDDEFVNGFRCFPSFAEAKQFYLECLDEKVTKALKLKTKDTK